MHINTDTHRRIHTLSEGSRENMCWHEAECHGNKRVPGELHATKHEARGNASSQFSSQVNKHRSRSNDAATMLQRTLLLETCSSRTSSSPPPLGSEGISLTSLFLTVFLLTVWLKGRESNAN